MLHGASHASSMHNLYTIGVHATVEFSDAILALMLQVNEIEFETSCKKASASQGTSTPFHSFTPKVYQVYKVKRQMSEAS